jgi:hypothetical protein
VNDRKVALLARSAERYTASYSLPRCHVDPARVVTCAGRGKRIGRAYLSAPRWEAAALPAYETFRGESLRQFDYLVRSPHRGGVGLRVESWRHDPYLDLSSLIRDIREYDRLRVWATVECGNPHPFLSNTENDAFRAVHDAFGHAATGRGFDVDGEEAAWVKHSTMYSPFARRAMTTETRGQNCAQVYCYGNKRFPEQKLCLLPPEFSHLSTVALRP